MGQITAADKAKIDALDCFDVTSLQDVSSPLFCSALALSRLLCVQPVHLQEALFQANVLFRHFVGELLSATSGRYRLPITAEQGKLGAATYLQAHLTSKKLDFDAHFHLHKGSSSCTQL